MIQVGEILKLDMKQWEAARQAFLLGKHQVARLDFPDCLVTCELCEIDERPTVSLRVTKVEPKQ